jgi:hypothetical protein
MRKLSLLTFITMRRRRKFPFEQKKLVGQAYAQSAQRSVLKELVKGWTIILFEFDVT